MYLHIHSNIIIGAKARLTIKKKYEKMHEWTLWTLLQATLVSY